MRRIALIVALIAATVGWIVQSAGADGDHTYRVELDNAFGLVTGSDVKIAGVKAGSITGLDVNAAKRAVVTVKVSGPFANWKKDASCSAEPQSLIAEFFLDCQPGTSPEPLPDNFVPVRHTTTTVQNDLVNNTLREPFKRRLQLIINEFGTALAGNSDNLNAAIRRGAPALNATEKVLAVLGRQNKVIRDLNVNSDTIISKLAANRQNVLRFIDTATASATATAQERTALAADFHLLPTTLSRLRASLVALGHVADQQTPLLSDLDRSAGQLFTLSRNLPGFADASRTSLISLGDAAVVGQRALTKAEQTGVIDQLKKASVNAFPAAKQIADFLVALDDPKRAVEVDARAARDTGRPAPTGYTGLEGLLNYAYYQTTAINQYDQVGHLLHFIIEGSFPGIGGSQCSEYNANQAWPTQSGTLTTNPRSAARCVSIVGDKQPDINYKLNLPPYSGGVCRYGSTDTTLCNPTNPRQARAVSPAAAAPPGGATPTTPGLPNLPQLPNLPNLPNVPGLPKGLNDVLGLQNGSPAELKQLKRLQQRGLLPRKGGDAAANDLLSFLFAN